MSEANPATSIAIDDRDEVEKHVRACKAIADILMCCSTAPCAETTLNALGEIVYDRLEEIEKTLGLAMAGAKE